MIANVVVPALALLIVLVLAGCVIRANIRTARYWSREDRRYRIAKLERELLDD